MAHNSNSTRTADVVIIGGGIIGSAIAFRMARSGVKVAVVDRAEPAAEASGAAAGMIAPQGEMLEPNHFFELSKTSRDLYPDFATEVEDLTEEDIHYRRDGTLLVAIDEDECKELEQIYAHQTRLGLPLERLTGATAAKRVAGLSPEIQLALLVPGDHWVDNQRLSRALVQAGRKVGVEFYWETTATGFNVQGDRVESVQATAGQGKTAMTFSANSFVLAAGCWSQPLAEMMGVSLAMQPCRGMMIEFTAPSALPCVVRSGIHYLVPRSGKTLVAGTTAEYVGYEKAVTAEGLESIIRGVSRIAPMIKKSVFQRAWCGLRPDTKDHYPIMGFGEAKNLIFATGHFRNGILLAPVTAKLITELLLTGSSSFPLEPYSPLRFKAQ